MSVDDKIYAKNETLLNFVKGEDDSYYSIPIYQREYSWQQENIDSFFNDLRKVINHTKDYHFFGSVVIQKKEKRFGSNYYQIIDGQQRLITLCLFMNGFLSFLKAKKDEYNSEKLEGWLYPKPPIKSRFDYPRLSFSLENVNNMYIRIVQHKTIREDRNSNLNLQYKYICQKVNKLFYKKDIENEIERIYDGLDKSYIVQIEIRESDDEAQEIFESLNSNGMPLSPSDLIKNYVLMNKTSNDQNCLYKIWTKIEHKFIDKSSLNNFLSDFITCKTKKSSTKKKEYSLFKKLWQTNSLWDSQNDNDKLGEILRFAKFYNILIYGKGYDKFPNIRISSNKNLEYIDTFNNFMLLRSKDKLIPILFTSINQLYKGQISIQQYVGIMKVINTFSFRIYVVKHIIPSLSGIMPLIIKAEQSQKNNLESSVNIYRSVFMNSQNKNLIVPEDNEIKRVLVGEKLRTGNSNLDKIINKYSSKYRENIIKNKMSFDTNYAKLSNENIADYILQKFSKN